MTGNLLLFALIGLLYGDGLVVGTLGFLGFAAVIGLVVAGTYWATAVRLSLSPAYRSSFVAVLRRTAQDSVHAGLFAGFVVLHAISLARATDAGMLSLLAGALQCVLWVTVPLLMVGIAADGERVGHDAALVRGLVVAMLLFTVLNAVLFAVAGGNAFSEGRYVTEAPGPALMLGTLGVRAQRSMLPLGGSWTTGGAVSSVALVMGAIMVARSQAMVARWYGVALAGLGGLLVLLTDARGALAAALIAVVTVVLLPGVMRRQARWLALAIPVLPIVMLLVLQFIVNQGWAASLNRGQTSATGLASGRPIMWATILNFLSHFRPEQLFGYGAYGQVASGVSREYGIYFVGMFASPWDRSAHNTFLQAILETGYVGAAIQVLLFWKLLRVLGIRSSERVGGVWTDVALGCTVCLVLLGVNDIVLSNPAPGTLTLFLALNVYCLTMDHRSAGARLDTRRAGRAPAQARA